MSKDTKERLEGLVRKHYKKSASKPKSNQKKQKETLALVSSDKARYLAKITVLDKDSEQVFLAEAMEHGIKKTLKQTEALFLRYYGDPDSNPENRLEYEVFVLVPNSRLQVPSEIWKEFSSFDK